MEALLRHVTSSLVQDPSQVRIEAPAPDSPSSAWRLRVAPEDFPRLIGRHGRTARALRLVFEAAQRGRRVALHIVDPEEGDGGYAGG